MDKLEDAILFAADAHRGQVRKYTGRPYIDHPLEVMHAVATVGADEDVQCAAVLHDVIEDCGVTKEQLEKRFGERVASLVWDLTDQCHDGNRRQRKACEAVRLALVSPEAQTIKVADFLSNTKDIIPYDPGFARVYLREKSNCLVGLCRADPHLYEMARAQLMEGMSKLGMVA